MLLGDAEKIEKSLFSPVKNFTIKVAVLLGNKSPREGFKMDCIYTKNYKSAKYSNFDTLSTTNVRTSDFLVFTYAYENKFEEIYISYPHLKRVIDGFENIHKLLFKDDSDVFLTEDDNIFLNAKYKNHYEKIEDLTNGKSLVLYPDVVRENDYEISGVGMYFIEPNNVVEMGFETFDAVFHFLKNFNLEMMSQILVNSQMIKSIYDKLNNSPVRELSRTTSIGGGNPIPKPSIITKNRKIKELKDNSVESSGELAKKVDSLFDDDNEPKTPKKVVTKQKPNKDKIKKVMEETDDEDIN
jgi:hypothetical protein